MQKVMRVLRKLYKYENSQYDVGREVSVYSQSTLSAKEQLELARINWQVNHIESFNDHADIMHKFNSLKKEEKLSQEGCFDTFIAGVGGSYLRGRSVLGAFHKLQNIQIHDYIEKPQLACCWVCSDYNRKIHINDSYFQYCLYYGNSYTGNTSYAYLNLKHLLNVEPVQPLGDDKIKFNQLLDLFRSAKDDETPGHFEKRLAEAKIIPGNKYTHRGVLQSLALIGVIPNQFIPLSLASRVNFGDLVSTESQLNNTKGRSDMEMPWAGWKGHLGIDEDKVAEYFSDYLL